VESLAVGTDVVVEVPVVGDVGVLVAVSGIDPTRAAPVHGDQLILGVSTLEDLDLGGVSELALDVVEHEVVLRAIQLFGTELDADVAQGARVDASAVSVAGLEDEDVVAEVVERVGSVQTRSARTHDDDMTHGNILSRLERSQI